MTQDETTLTLANGGYGTENDSFSTQGRQGEWSWRVSSQKDLLGDYKDGRGATTPAI